mgnify:FL=1
MPVIEERAKRYVDSSTEDCLLNPIFRWCYLNKREERLTALEREMKNLNYFPLYFIFVDDVLSPFLPNIIHIIIKPKITVANMLYAMISNFPYIPPILPPYLDKPEQNNFRFAILILNLKP